MKYITQLLLGGILFVVAAICALYEGSAVRDIPWEWAYTTPFSQLFGISIVTGQEISQLDYLVYAAKYQPVFPILMLISLCYSYFVLRHWVVRHYPKAGQLLTGVVSVLFIGASIALFKASTTGGILLFWLLLSMALINSALSFKFLKPAVQ